NDSDGKVTHFGADDLYVRVPLFEIPPGPADSSARADAGDKMGDLAISVVPNLRPSRDIVSKRVCRVTILIGIERVRRGGVDAFGRLVIVVGSSVFGGCGYDDDIGSERFEIPHLFDRDLVGQDKDAFIATHSGNQ